MAYKVLGYKLPYCLSRRLFGDRKTYTMPFDERDKDWLEWQKTIQDFYENTQKKSVGNTVNEAGYDIVKNLDFSNKTVLEVGPANLGHIKHWKNKPDLFYAADINEQMLGRAQSVLQKHNVKHQLLFQNGSDIIKLPIADNGIDIYLTFYSLEHLFPLESYLNEAIRVLKPGGYLVGAIPAEGGLAWGLGRFFTSRRWLLKNTQINPDKIICWEHPNFSDVILKALGERFLKVKMQYWPFKLPNIDCNLVIKFIYQKPRD